jgi:hypothetical protein
MSALAELTRPDVDETIAVPNRLWEHQEATYCRLRVWRKGFHSVALATEIAGNHGLSVTNNIENVVAYVWRHYGKATVIEHYDENSWEGRRGAETFDLVTVDDSAGTHWTHLGYDELAALIA